MTIELKRKPIELLIRGLCGFLALFTLFLLTLSLIFSFGGDAPSLFGRNIYIVKTEAVEFLKPGTALFTRAVPYDEILAGDIVVFKSLETNRAGMAEIESFQELDGVYRYTAFSERDVKITLTQSQIVGKATQYSNFFGGLIGFAKSPTGVLVIAVVPCIIILIYESSKSIFAAFVRDRRVSPVKKQDEIPTYVPRYISSSGYAAKSNNSDNSANSDNTNGEKFTGYDGYVGLNSADYDGYNKALAEAARSDGFADDDYPLFRPPGAKPEKPKPLPEKRSEPPRVTPLSQKRLNQAIAEVNARKSVSEKPAPAAAFPYDDETPALASSETNEINQIKEIKVTGSHADNVKRYTPKKGANQRAAAYVSSVPSLDRLLRDDDADNSGYDIESILHSLDRKR